MEVARILGCSDRHVRNRLSLWEYKWREEQGRKQLVINARSLPKEACDRYVLETLPDLEEVKSPTIVEDRDALIRAVERSNNRNKRHFEKWSMILQYSSDITGRRELERWVEEWNAEHPDKKTSAQSIYRQRALTQEFGYMALVNENRVAPCTVKDVWFDDFKNAYLTQNKLSVFSAWMIAKGKAIETGDIKSTDVFPSKTAFERRLHREVSPDVIYYAREGQHKFYNNKGYYSARNYDDVQAGQVWVGDTRTWDVFVKVPGSEVPKTCYITLFLDMKTYMPMGYQMHVDAPGTDNTLRAIANGIVKYGLPSEILVDNGREYRNKDFSGQSRGNKICEDEQKATSLVSRLGIKIHFAIVRNARAKIIERQFLVIKNGFDKLFNSYKGGSVAEKPENLKAVLKRGDYLEWDEFKSFADEYLTNIFPSLPCDGKIHQGKSRGALWNELIMQRDSMPRVTQETLAMLTSRTVAGTLGKRGFHIAELDTWYWAEWMPVHKGKSVTLRYDPADMRIAWCYGQDGVLLGECRIIESIGAMVRNDDAIGKTQIAEGVQRRRREEKIMKELVPGMTRNQARESITALTYAVGGPHELLIPEGPIQLTSHDSDASALKADAKVGSPSIISLLSEDTKEERKHFDIFGDDDTLELQNHG